MSWSEIKKLSDVMIDSTRFSEVITKIVSGNDNSVAIEGCGEARIYTPLNTHVNVIVDGVVLWNESLWTTNRNDNVTANIPFNKSVVVVLTTEYSSAKITAFLRDNISIGGGYSKLVPFNRRKAVAA